MHKKSFVNKITADNKENILGEFTQPVRRRDLLPWWIKGCSLLFMLSGVLATGCLVVAVFGVHPSLAFYGFDTDNAFSIDGLTVLSVFILKGFAAWALWFEKDYAILLGEADATLCIVSMIVMPYLQPDFKGSIRLELLLLFPYLIKLIKIKDRWRSAISL